MDDLELSPPPKAVKEKIVYWASYVLGIVGVFVLLWHFIRLQP
jgi:hypothetical protein